MIHPALVNTHNSQLILRGWVLSHEHIGSKMLHNSRCQVHRKYNDRINWIISGHLPSRSGFWEAEAQNSLLIDIIATAPVHLHFYVSLCIHIGLPLLLSAAPFPCISLPRPYSWSFSPSATLLFSLMHNLWFLVSCGTIFPWLLLSLHRSPLLTQNNGSDLSEHVL